MVRNECRGYSLIAWTVTLTALLAAISLAQIPLKRAFQRKVAATTDYALWNYWGSTMPSEDEDDYDDSKQKTKRTRREKRSLSQNAPGDLIGVKVTQKFDPAVNYQRQKTVSANVADGSESLLNNVNLNEFTLDPDK